MQTFIVMYCALALLTSGTAFVFLTAPFHIRLWSSVAAGVIWPLTLLTFTIEAARK